MIGTMPDTAWRKSSYSGGSGTCVEVADLPAGRAVRDSKLGDHSPVLAVPTGQFTALLEAVKSGQLG
jgi:Domain of unknown function (DUF397)